MMEREIAWRTFAVEFNSSDLEVKGEGEKTPSYIVTPLGAMVNRIFVCGVITDLQNVGSDEDPLWRARMSDPTGVYYISAGQYQPEAAAEMAKIKPPTFAAIIGKVRTYKPEDGVVYLSIRPEVVKQVDAKERDIWVLETCKSMRRRIEAMREAMAMDPPTIKGIEALGYPTRLADGVVRAIEHYKDVDLDRYTRVLVESLRYLMPDHGDYALTELEAMANGSKAPARPDIEEIPLEETAMGKSGGARAAAKAKGPASPKAKKDMVAKEAEKEDDIEAKESKWADPEAVEARLMEIVDELDDGMKGAAWEQIIAKAKADGIDAPIAEEALNILQDRGDLCEPEIGKLKKV